VLRVGFVTGSDREHDVDGVCPPSTSPISWRALCSTPEGRETDLHQPSGLGPVFAAEGRRSADHQPARLETRPCPSEGVLPNTDENRTKVAAALRKQMQGLERLCEQVA